MYLQGVIKMKKKIFVSTISTILVVLFVVVAFSACCSVANKQLADGVLHDDSVGDSKGEFVIASANTKALKLAVAPIAAENADVKTVSVTNAVDVFTYEWSLSSGGDNYVTLSATTGTSVNVSVKQAFGSKITLTCTAKFDGDEISSATCTLGYYKRPTGMTFGGVDRANGTNIDLGAYMGVTAFNEMFGRTIDFTANSCGVVSFGVGTEDFSPSGAIITLFESDSGFSYTLFSPTFDGRKVMDFSELVYRVACAQNGTQYDSKKYSTWLSGLSSAVAQGHTEALNYVYSMVSGKTFTINCSIVNTEKNRLDNVAISFTVPTNLTIPRSNYNPSLSDADIVF